MSSLYYITVWVMPLDGEFPKVRVAVTHHCISSAKDSVKTWLVPETSAYLWVQKEKGETWTVKTALESQAGPVKAERSNHNLLIMWGCKVTVLWFPCL